jgi:hypothetical protein
VFQEKEVELVFKSMDLLNSKTIDYSDFERVILKKNYGLGLKKE